jgi:hypothetical protein
LFALAFNAYISVPFSQALIYVLIVKTKKRFGSGQRPTLSKKMASTVPPAALYSSSSSSSRALLL